MPRGMQRFKSRTSELQDFSVFDGAMYAQIFVPMQHLHSQGGLVVGPHRHLQGALQIGRARDMITVVMRQENADDTKLLSRTLCVLREGAQIRK